MMIKVGETNFIVDDNGVRFFGASSVPMHEAIPDPTGGLVVDIQARAAIVLILEELRNRGLVAA